MTFEEFVVAFADVEGKEALQKAGYDFWQQASEEDRIKLVTAIDQVQGHMHKVVKSFWACCGVHYTDGWVTVDGKSYAVAPVLVKEGKIAFPEKVVVKNTTGFKTRTAK